MVRGITDKLCGEIAPFPPYSHVSSRFDTPSTTLLYRVFNRADSEAMELVETWINSHGTEGRVTRIETTFAPKWIRDQEEEYIFQLPQHAEL